MSTVKTTAVEFFSNYGTSCDSRSSNDCYRVFSGQGTVILDVFMHSTIGIKPAFSITNLGRNEDIKANEAEIIDEHHNYDVFNKFGLDISFCNHFLEITVKKPSVKNYETKFQMHNQIFEPSTQLLRQGIGKMTEEDFYANSNLSKNDLYPNEWFINEAKRKNFFLADVSGFTLDYGFSVMGKTTSYWKESMEKTSLISVKQKSMNNPLVPTNRLLSASTIKAVEIASQIAFDKTTILAVKQSLNSDLKTQFRISLPGEYNEAAIARTFLINQGRKGQYICIYAKTVMDKSNERTTLIIKIVTQNRPGEYVSMLLPKDHSDCRKVIGASFGIVEQKLTDPNYNKIIANELLSVHTKFALKISKILKKPVVVYKIYEKELFSKKMEIEGRTFNYQEDVDGNVYFLSATLAILPLSVSVLSYLDSASPSCWKESRGLGHFTVEEVQ
ncbi:NSs [Alstroemeria yellow spot virus]|uniref:NSs n=1 Tax=Alstroemeria yellow spot virus TaxID=2212644 RepID=A0A344AIH2_9VIRU|nr:NSs [Alstroemeria yellow spot virus]AWV56663.1 NSs [Alstroemeria yellow spot virus]